MNDLMFKHQALGNPAQSIRLIQVKSQPTISPLELSLSTHLVTDNVPYFAVSYTWGDSGFIEKLLINGRCMMVTKNCYYALTQIITRYPFDPSYQEDIYLWIDSICINQDDNEEKGHQVAMMGDIYTKATKVLACIGPHADNSQMLRSVLDDIKMLHPEVYSKREELHSGCWSYSVGILGCDGSIRKLFRAYPHDFTIFEDNIVIQYRQACLAFANRRYWSTVWIIQEFTATTLSGNELEILCGCDSFSKAEINLCFYIGAALFDERSTSDPQEGRLYSDRYRNHCFKTLMRFHASKPISVGSILFYIGNLFHCTKPEDKVYGLLSLVEWPEGVAPIQPTYGPSSALDLAELLTSITPVQPWTSESILAALGIYHDHKLPRPLMEARILNPAALSSRHGKYGLRSTSINEEVILAISMNGEGQLSASLNRNSFEGTGIVEEKARLLQADRRADVSQLLFVDGQVAGLLCGGAREGDVILQAEYESRVILILRSNNHIGQYDLVGQGLLSSKFNFPYIVPSSVGLLDKKLREVKDIPPRKMKDHDRKIQSLERELAEASRPGHGDMKCLVELRAEPIEWLMLVCHDITDTDVPDTEKRLERLHIKINMEATII